MNGQLSNDDFLADLIGPLLSAIMVRDVRAGHHNPGLDYTRQHYIEATATMKRVCAHVQGNRPTIAALTPEDFCLCIEAVLREAVAIVETKNGNR